MISISNKNQTYIFFFFIVSAIVLRFFSFFPSVMDHDESTYLIIGRDILNGKALYTDVTDTKPVGIFLFYAGLEYLFGSSIFLKRLIFAILVGITGFLILKVSIKLFKQNKVAYAAGLIYIIYTSIWNYHGRSPNTELLFNLCTIASLNLFQTKKYLSFISAGLILGIGFIIKYLVLFDIAAFLLFFFIIENKDLKSKSFWPVFGRYVAAGIAFLLPFAFVNLYFWLGDNFQNFYFITYELPKNYGGSPSLLRYFTMIADFIGKFLPISILVFYVIFKKNKPIETQYKWFFALWIFAVLIAIYIPGKEFSHYTIQLMLPLSLLTGIYFHPDFTKDKITGSLYSRKIGVPIMVVIILAIQIISFQNEVIKPDYELEVAKYLEEKMDENDQIFVSNYQQIIYYLLDVESPTKYIHSNLLFTQTHKVFEIDAEQEITRIINTNPKFVLIQRKNELVESLIKSNYQLVKKFKNDQILVYQLNN